MGLNDTPAGERIYISFFGTRNAGKSSIVNAVTNQELSIVSDVEGTTTDPVYKSMELLPLGPVMIVDTAGFDDSGELGQLRVKKTRQVLGKTDIAVLVVDIIKGLSVYDYKLIELFKQKGLNYIIAYNKFDLLEQKPNTFKNENEIVVSANSGYGIEKLKNKIGSLAKNENNRCYIRDLIKPQDVVVLVTPIDSSAPRGRLILPQQQAIRDILDTNAISIVTKETELEKTLSILNTKPKMVITDSQAFENVAKYTPKDITLTSFSILMARYKGFLDIAVLGAKKINELRDNDIVLISEGCTHHRQCQDIGTVKIPKWLGEFTGKKLIFETTSGTEFPEDLTRYALVIHCGGCMLNEREIKARMNHAAEQNVPITNYGIAIALMKGVLDRSIEPFNLLCNK